MGFQSDVGAIQADLGWIWGGFWNDFCLCFEVLEGTSISETFQVEGLTSMIRATRGRSRRPNHMRSLLESKTL